MNYSCRQQHEWILENVIVNKNRQTGVQKWHLSFTKSHLQDLMLYTEPQEQLPILNDKEEINSFGSYHRLIFCYVFLLKMLQLHNRKKFKNPETREYCCILRLKSLCDQYEQLNEAHRRTAEVQRARKQQSPLTTLQGGHYESNWNILHKFKKTSVWRYIWRHFCTLSKELSFTSGTAISTSYKSKSPRLFSCYKCEYALSLFYHCFMMLGYFHWNIKVCL